MKLKSETFGYCTECETLKSENARLKWIIERANATIHRQYSHSELKPIINILSKANNTPATAGGGGEK